MSNETTASDRGVAIGGGVRNSTIHTGDTIIPPKPPTPHQLRKPLDDFVGREKEIVLLCETLRRGGRAGISGINGMGGIGKTELALLVADRLCADYPDAQLFVKLEGTSATPLTPELALASCIRAFVGAEARLPDDLNELSNLYHSLLSGQRALVLLDNAANLAQVKPLIPPAGCVLLVTSRQPIALPGMERIWLDELAPTEARELLLSLAARVTPELADQICYLCGYLPLAIRAAGSLLAVTEDLDVAEYTAQLKDERKRLASIGEEGVEIGVEASFNLSYARLNEEAARVFRGLCVFPGSFDARAEEAICEDTGHKHLSELVKRSLVLFEPTEQRYRLHDLVRVFAANRCSDAEHQIHHQRHAEYFLAVLTEADRLYLQGGAVIKEGLALFDREWSNARAGWEWTSRHTETPPRAVELCSEYPNASPHIANLRQHPRERIVWREVALAAAQKLGRKDAQSVHLGNLGVAYADLSETRRAIEFYEQSLLIYRESGDHKGEGQVLNNLGNAYLNLGETRRAIEFYEQSLPIRRKIGDRRGEGATLNNLGIAYADLGEYRRAIEFYEQSLPIRRVIGDRRGEGHTLGNLGLAYADLGEPRRAIKFYEQQLAITRVIGDRRGEGNALWNTALALEKLGDRAQAIASAEAALMIREQIEDPNAAKVREQLAAWRGEGGAADE